jgi:hypothetical protein
MSFPLVSGNDTSKKPANIDTDPYNNKGSGFHMLYKGAPVNGATADPNK